MLLLFDQTKQNVSFQIVVAGLRKMFDYKLVFATNGSELGDISYF
ncbi:hypothetical protein B0O44_1049 [Pedobacter nutrimenti]|uniref:Uncharacterized protein n=1 Tax=Pedobacter nutrimenti TaxID=1241337 RepID=A0A318UED8_9SPHI|nr:hypothetical protein B0O44_1049 [Pedobacter nutrimenti]